jgi:hypothetical protein
MFGMHTLPIPIYVFHIGRYGTRRNFVQSAYHKNAIRTVHLSVSLPLRKTQR